MGTISTGTFASGLPCRSVTVTYTATVLDAVRNGACWRAGTEAVNETITAAAIKQTGTAGATDFMWNSPRRSDRRDRGRWRFNHPTSEWMEKTDRGETKNQARFSMCQTKQTRAT